MLDEDLRTTILRLRQEGLSIRAIAKACRKARGSVKAVLRSGSREVPEPGRAEKAEPWREEILRQFKECRGNLVRVHEKLRDQGADFSYQALTAFCRRNRIGSKPKPPAGRYTFAEAEEMQHDTSPHRVRIGGKVRQVQCASLVLCFSRVLFMQYYPTFDRFWCKVFLTEALQYFGGTCARCMIDNTHVVVSQGTGEAMIPAPEMEAFAARLGFVFRAHEKGDANRSARVERNFAYVEGNFLAGREFRDWEDLNRQARQWCEMANAKEKRELLARPIDLFAREQPLLRSLPAFVPEVYRLHHRIVDGEGHVNLHRNAFSVPYQLIGHQVEVRESQHRIEVFDGPRRVASHPRPWDARNQRFTLKEHRPPRGEGRAKAGPIPEETELLALEPRLVGYLAALKAKFPGRTVRMLRRLRSLLRDYPRAPFLNAVIDAMAYGMFDLDRLEGMILRNVRKDYFVLRDTVSAETPHEG
jgi:transposase